MQNRSSKRWQTFAPRGKNAILINAVVISDICEFYYDDEKQKIKTTFRIKTTLGNEKDCYSWKKYTSLKKGDKVQITGKLTDKGFVVWTLLIIN